MNVMTERLTERMVSAGFSVSEPLDGSPAEEFRGRSPELRRLWFTPPDSGVAGLDSAIIARLTRETGRLCIQGRAWIGSPTLGDMAKSLHQRAFDDAHMESVPFAYFDNPNDMSRELDIRSETSLDYVADKFMAYVCGPATQWLSERDSLDKLFALAPMNNPRNIDLNALGQAPNPDATRLRGVAVLGVENGRPEATAALLKWYSARTKFHHWDSTEQVAAFDTALAQRFPTYARM